MENSVVQWFIDSTLLPLLTNVFYILLCVLFFLVLSPFPFVFSLIFCLSSSSFSFQSCVSFFIFFHVLTSSHLFPLGNFPLFSPPLPTLLLPYSVFQFSLLLNSSIRSVKTRSNNSFLPLLSS